MKEIELVEGQLSIYDTPADAFARGMAGSDLAGQKWTDLEREAIDKAILRCAVELVEFTADDVWAQAPGIRVTKGLAGRLNAAKNRGLIRPTGEIRLARRGGAHDHAQRLAVWTGRRS